MAIAILDCLKDTGPCPAYSSLFSGNRKVEVLFSEAAMGILTSGIWPIAVCDLNIVWGVFMEMFVQGSSGRYV